jgi:ADP-ribose pyrophosphatase
VPWGIIELSTGGDIRAMDKGLLTGEMKKDGIGHGGSGLAWEEVSRETVVKDEWIDFRRLSFRFPDGSVAGPFYSYTRSDYAVILAMDEDGRCICVTQYRQGIREVTTEFPAGGIEWNGRDSGGTREEQALAAAKRELREETGYISDSWEHLLTVPSDATLSDNYAHIYLAKDCRRSFDQELDRMEFLNVKLYTVREMEEMIRAGRFQQAVHVMAWYMARCLYIG